MRCTSSGRRGATGRWAGGLSIDLAAVLGSATDSGERPARGPADLHVEAETAGCLLYARQCASFAAVIGDVCHA